MTPNNLQQPQLLGVNKLQADPNLLKKPKFTPKFQNCGSDLDLGKGGLGESVGNALHQDRKALAASMSDLNICI